MLDLEVCAKWTDDCQGKKDYDGRIVSVSTRYWPGPGAGGTHVLENGNWSIIPYGDKPSAISNIVINFGEPSDRGYGQEFVVATKEFEGDTEEDVKKQVEAWVKEKFDKIHAAVLEALKE